MGSAGSHTKPKVKICALPDVFASQRIHETCRPSENILHVSLTKTRVCSISEPLCRAESPQSPVAVVSSPLSLPAVSHPTPILPRAEGGPRRT